jgi:ParB family chromosome partitioning protein
MERIGFVVPLIVVERDKDGAKRYVVIDGQHRFAAGKSAGIERFPVIVVPPALAPKMMNFNVEKDLNIREKSSISLSLYREVVENQPDMKEDDSELVDSIEQAHYVTLGLAYEKAARLAGSSFEPVLKRCDGFLDEPVKEALGIREERAKKVLEAYQLVKSIGDKLKEKGAWHTYVGAQIMSYANPLKRKRGAVEFDEAFEKLIAKLKELEEHPEKVLKQPVG